MRINYISILAILIILSSIIQNSYIILKIPEPKPVEVSGQASGQINLCISHGPPENITLIGCPNRTREGAEAYCFVTADSPDNTNITFGDSGEPFFEVSSNGSIYIRTYNESLESPPLYDKYSTYLGNHSILISAYSHCGDANDYVFDFEVYDVNDPPFMTQSLPNVTIYEDTPSIMFNIKNYYIDPEEQTLTPGHSNETGIVITSYANGNIEGFTSICANFTMTFWVTDPGGLSSQNSTININVYCEEDEDEGGDEGDGTGIGLSPACVPFWECSDWTDCTPNGTTTKTCVDRNACDSDFYIYTVENECTYIPPIDCEEYWECGEWGLCQPDNTSTRTCEELNGCGTEFLKPITVMECIYEPTCSDGIQNQGETGVDCGGPCLPCKTIEVPGIIKEQKTIISTLMLLIILGILSLLIIYKYFHKEINSAAVKVLLSITKKRGKKILLTDKDKKYLLDKVLEVEKKTTDKNTLKKSMELSVICREYFSLVFKKSITLTKEQLEEGIKKLKIKELLSNIFLSFYDKTVLVETKKLKLHKIDILVMIEELREIIHQTSDFKEKDIGKEEIKEMEIYINDSLANKIKKNIYNIYITLHFEELEAAKERYTEIIKLYEKLDEKKKGDFYYDLERIFNEIKLLLSFLK